MLRLRPYQSQAVIDIFCSLRESDHPILLVASVGSGKSLIISEVVQQLEHAGKRVLCLVNNSELVRNNAKTYREQGGSPSIFCSTLNEKCIDNPIIFATPQSVISAIKRDHKIASIAFNLIVVDEAHCIAYLNEKTVFMRILRHYKQLYSPMRLLGLTGTPFRGKGDSIVGDVALFKKSIGNINTPWLIDNGYLVRPKFGYHSTNSLDFSNCLVQNNGEFKSKDLQEIVNQNHRLTGEILIECQSIMASRKGAFVFCATVEHCHEAMRALPSSARMIVGSTPDKERHEILTDAREGRVVFLVSVNCLMVGVDVPLFDTIIWLRPTTSLVLYVQGIGRGLRLHQGKDSCAVLDFAGNLDRFGDFDHPMINEALKPHPENEKDYVITCYTCNTMNSLHARRCIGIIGNQRCDHYFVWKDCHACGAKNDSVCRYCRECKAELIDPNAKLKKMDDAFEVGVIHATYNIHGQTVFANYVTHAGVYGESFSISSDKSRNIFYARFVRLHLPKPSSYYMHLKYPKAVEAMLRDEGIRTPSSVVINAGGVKKKCFT